MTLYLRTFNIYANRGKIYKKNYISRTIVLTELILCLKEPETPHLYTTFVEIITLKPTVFKL